MEIKSLRMQFLAAGAGMLVYFISGNYGGWPAPTIPRLVEGSEEPHLTADEGSWVVSIIHFAQVVSCLPGGYLANYIGRKKVLLMSSIPFLISWILVIFANSVGLLYASRVIGGLGLGLISTVAPMYMIEIAEDRVRGALGTLFMVMMKLGLTFVHCVGPYVSRSVLGIILTIFPILFVATFIWMPESPSYYLMRNQRHEAELSLLRLRCKKDPEDVQEELNKMQKFVEMKTSSKNNIKDLLFQRGNRKALLIMTGLLTLQHLGGIMAILSYATSIFKESGISFDENITVIIMDIIQVFCCAISSSIVDIAGRRPILLASTVCCSIALTIKGIFFCIKNQPDSDMTGFDWVIVVAMILYISSYALGLGPIPNAISSEIFPIHVKGIALSIGAMIMGLGAAVVTKLYQVLADAFGLHVVFWTFAFCTFVNTLFVTFVVPETKGKTLMQIHQELSSEKHEENEEMEAGDHLMATRTSDSTA